MRWGGVLRKSQAFPLTENKKSGLLLHRAELSWLTPPTHTHTHKHIKYIHTRTHFSSVFNCVGNGIDFLFSWRDDITVRGEQHVGGSSACRSLVERTMIGQRSQRGRWKARDCVNILLQQKRKRAVKGVSYCFLTINAYTLTYHEWEGLHSDTDLIGKATSDI